MNPRRILFNKSNLATFLTHNPFMVCHHPNPRHSVNLCSVQEGLSVPYQVPAQCPADESRKGRSSYHSEAPDDHPQGFWQKPQFEGEFGRKKRVDFDMLVGSGIGGEQLDANPCGSMRSGQEGTCRMPAVKMCRSCSLVSYCGSKCQEKDWHLHKAYCESAPMHKDWSPALASPLHFQQELPKSCNFLWGNVPAYSILADSGAERELPEHLRLCFAASGDLRNIIETVCELPPKCEGTITLYINDRNPKIAARNFLLLELLKEFGHEAIDAVIGAWYSSFLTKQQSSLINRIVTCAARRHWCNDPSEKDKEAFFSNICEPASRSSLITHYSEEVWETISAMRRSCDLLEDLPSSRVARTDILCSRFAQRKLPRLRPAHRLGWLEFHKSGLLLPFGASRAAFTHPNPFLLQAPQSLPDKDEDPLNGWNPVKLIPAGLSHGLSRMDLYGCLFFYLRQKLTLFLNRLHAGNIKLRLFCDDASELARQFKASNTYLHSVDTSNISDSNYLGIQRVLLDWGPLLDRSSDYKATLITFLMNWAYEEPGTQEQHAAASSKLTWTDVEAAISCIAQKGAEAKDILSLLMEGNEAGDVSLLNYFHDFDEQFSKYLSSRFAVKVAAEVGLQRRRKHCLVPHRFFVDASAAPTLYPGLQATFEQCYLHTVVGELNMTECFVEWEASDQ